MHGMHTVYFIKDLNDLLWMLVSVSWQLDVLMQPRAKVSRSSQAAPTVLQVPVSQLQHHLGAQQSSHLTPALDGVLTAIPCAWTTAVILAGAV